MIHVIATVQVQPSRRADFLSEFHKVVPLVLQEPGCVEYGPTIDAVTDIGAQQLVGEDFVVIVERWASVEALKAHLVANHMTAYRQRVKEMVVVTKLQILKTA